MNPLDHDWQGWKPALEERRVSARALAEACLERIARLDANIRAVSHLDRNNALAAAEASDRRRAAGEARGPLDGLPMLFKDNIDVAGLPTTAGLVPRRDHVAGDDAVVVAKLRAAGVVVLGKVTMHEAALGATNENPLTGRTFNPHRAGFTPGGSSGGSGAATAAGFSLAALGTDTLGSVRIPAAYCGVVGHKPTRGLVSKRGVVPLSWTLDHVGPIGRSVTDVAAILSAIAGYDAASPESVVAPPETTQVPEQPDLRGVRLGRLSAIDRVAVVSSVLEAFAKALDVLRALGATIVQVDLPDNDFGRVRRTGLLVSEAEGAFAHAELLAKHPEQFSPELRTLLTYGRDAGSQALIKAQRTIAEILVATRLAFAPVDAIVLPTAPQPAFDFATPVPVGQADFTAIANLTGRPAVSLPMGWSDQGLPLGLQLIGHPFGDARVLAIAQAYERAAGWDMRPRALD